MDANERRGNEGTRNDGWSTNEATNVNSFAFSLLLRIERADRHGEGKNSFNAERTLNG